MTTSTTYTEINLSSYVIDNMAYNPATFPTGTTTGNEGLGIPFSIANYNGEAGFWNPDYLPGNSVGGNVAGASLSVNLLPYNLTGQNSFYALLNNYWGTIGTNEYNITITATDGDSYTYSAIGGQNTRDYNQNTSNTISGTTSNWFSNGIGQRLDAREFQLPTTFANETLASFTINQINGHDAVVFGGLTGAVTTQTEVVNLVDPVPTVTLANAPSANNATSATLGTAAPGTAGDALQVAITADADFASGSKITLVNGTLVYTPGTVTAAAVGNDTISYTVTDSVTGAVVHETQTITLHNGPNPVVTLAALPAADNAVSATLGSAVAGANGDKLAVTLTADADFATGSAVSLAADGSTILYTPGNVTAADVGTDAISFTVTDTLTGAVTTEHLTVRLGAGSAPIGAGGNDVVNLDGYNNVVKGPTSAASSNGNNGPAISGVPNGYQTLTGTAGSETINAWGYGNTIIGNGGNDTINAGTGFATVTVSDANGNNVVRGGDGNSTVTLGNGNNTVSGTVGALSIATGNGNQTITAGGYHNQISTDAGNSTINAGVGNAVVSVGAGTNSIIAGGNDNTIITGLGNDSVALSGWYNTLEAGAGATSVSGGYANTYEVTALGSAGGLSIADFNAPYGDVLDLSHVVSAASQLSAVNSGNDLLISASVGGATLQVADLHGLAGTSLTSMIAAHSLVV